MYPSCREIQVHDSFTQDLHDDVPSGPGLFALIAVFLIDAFYTVGFKNLGLLLQSESFQTYIMLYFRCIWCFDKFECFWINSPIPITHRIPGLLWDILDVWGNHVVGCCPCSYYCSRKQGRYSFYYKRQTLKK